MSETRICRLCGIEKTLATEFYWRKDINKYRTECKACLYSRLKDWRNTPEGKGMLLEQTRRYRRTEKGKACAYRATRRQTQEFRPKVRARYSVYRAVKNGTLPHVKTLACSVCGKPAQQYHHHMGYEREHWLSVVPVCIPCHTD